MYYYTLWLSKSRKTPAALKMVKFSSRNLAAPWAFIADQLHLIHEKEDGHTVWSIVFGHLDFCCGLFSYRRPAPVT